VAEPFPERRSRRPITTTGLADPMGARPLLLDTDRARPSRSQSVGVVTYGRWQLGRLDGTGRLADLPRPDPYRWDLLLAEVPHSLRFDGDAPSWVSVGFEMLDEACAYDILPRSVTRRQEDTTIYTISSSLRFTRAENVLRGSPYEVPLDPLEPIVTDAGLGEGSFGWSYRAPHGSALVPGVRRCWAILQIPRGLRDLRVRAVALFQADRSRGSSEPFGFTVDLPREHTKPPRPAAGG
jgi:hypothetical protein